VDDEARLAEVSKLDVEAIVAFFEHLALNLGAMWREAKHGQRQAVQRFVFPEGLAWAPSEGFQTARCGLFFSDVAVVPAPDVRDGVDDGIRTRGLQGHNLAL
jgi:hypothetical protein